MKNTGLAILFGIIGLLIGGIVTYALFPQVVIQDKIVTEEVVKEVTVEKSVEVAPDYKQKVVDALLLEAQKDAAFRKCGGDKYDFEEISVKKVYEGFTLTENSDGDIATSGVKVKLSYDDGDCYETFTCKLDSDKNLIC